MPSMPETYIAQHFNDAKKIMNAQHPLVSIRCLVYNHEPYLRQCLDGFVMQKTNFPFEAIVHDDASTDNSAAIIREYEEKYPHIIKPVYQTENQYSKKDGSLKRALNSAMSPSSRYIAVCEGDDYWTDPLKLQKQVDFLEAHPDYSMCFHETQRYSQRRGCFYSEVPTYNKSREARVKDLIETGSPFVSTCSILYRRSLLDCYPDYCRRCHVGDLPLQVFCAVNGKCFYIRDTMAVYRVDNPGSWSGQHSTSKGVSPKLKAYRSEIDMMHGFSRDYPQYLPYFRNFIAKSINIFYSLRYQPSEWHLIKEEFRKEISQYSWYWKMHLWLLPVRNTIVWRYGTSLVYHLSHPVFTYHKLVDKIKHRNA